MKKINVLWMSRYLPLSTSAEAGNKTFYHYFRKIAGNPEFDIYLVASGNYENKAQVEKELSGYRHSVIYWGDPKLPKWKKALNIESRYNPYNRNANLISNTDDQQFREILSGLADLFTPDIAILEWTNMLVYASQVKSLFPSCKIVASEHDVSFIGYERKHQYYKGLNKWYWGIKARNEKKKELRALQQCDLVFPHNPDNIEVLAKEGIDRTRIRWLVPYFNDLGVCKRINRNHDILFFGAMARQENYLSAIWFIENVMPLLADLDFRFVVLGSNPPDRLKQYANDKIVVTGFVDSVLPYYQEAAGFAAPLVLGAGIKVKVLESLSSGIPVITNDIGIEGIPAQPGEEYIHADTPEEYASAVRRAVSGEIEEIGRAGKAFIHRNYDLQIAADTYVQLLHSLSESHITENER